MAVSLKIGTRGSPLALAQAHETRRRLASAHRLPEEAFEIIVIKTTGDAITDRPLSEAGGKGLFTKELDIAQLEGRIDIAVHSGKDLPTALPEGLTLAGFLPREDARDALISARATTVAGLPQGAVVGTASLRRAAQVKRLRPDIETILLRGNVETRLRKAESGEIDATLLAMAGLNRLGLAARATAALPIEDFLPAVGQGAIAICARAQDAHTRQMLAPIIDADTTIALACERAFLAVLDGSCRTPIAGHAHVGAERIYFRGLVLRTDGSQSFGAGGEAGVEDAAALGERAARDILARLPPGVLGAA
ncbi:MAG: hydroxymethylbilane synthase [Hyphomicrobiales bacterium]|nr:hydroxymethylbilane synthase [Hyphomicrobiales bacterium]